MSSTPPVAKVVASGNGRDDGAGTPEAEPAGTVARAAGCAAQSGTTTDAPTFADRPSRESLPEAFRAFLRRNHVDEAVYDIVPADLPRFIR